LTLEIERRPRNPYTARMKMSMSEDGQMTLPGMSFMTMTLVCRECRAVVQDAVALGAGAGPLLAKFGWTRDDAGFLCPDCGKGAGGR
jgi:hypothetical protein